jgi:hypothetical protein
MKGLLALSLLLLAVLSTAQKPVDCREVLGAVTMAHKASDGLSPASGASLLKSLGKVSAMANKLKKCPGAIQEIMAGFDDLLSRVATRTQNADDTKISLGLLNRLWFKFGRFQDAQKCFEYMNGIKVHSKMYDKTLKLADSAKAQFYKDAATIREWQKTLQMNKNCVLPTPKPKKSKTAAKVNAATKAAKDLLATLTKKNTKKAGTVAKKDTKNTKKPLPAAAANKKKLNKQQKKKKLAKIIKKRSTYVDKIIKKMARFAAASEMAGESIAKFSSIVRISIIPPAPVNKF